MGRLRNKDTFLTAIQGKIRRRRADSCTDPGGNVYRIGVDLMQVPHVYREAKRKSWAYRRNVPESLQALYGSNKFVRGLGKLSGPEVAIEAARLDAYCLALFAKLRALPEAEKAQLLASGGYKNQAAHIVQQQALAAVGRVFYGDVLKGAAMPDDVALTLLRAETAPLRPVDLDSDCRGLIDVWHRHSEAADKTRERYRYEKAFDAFHKVVGAKRPADVVKADVVAFHTAMQNTANGGKHWRCVATAFKLAALEDIVSKSYFEGFKVPKPATRNDGVEAQAMYSADDVKAIRSALNEFKGNRDFVRVWRVLMATGCRSGEAVRLRRADVKLNGDVVTMTFRAGTKKGGAREVPAHPALAADLMAWKAEGDSPSLFPDYRDKPHNFQDAGNSWLKRVLPGVPVTVHDSRHTVNSWLAADPLTSEPTRLAIVGHTGGNVNARVYTHGIPAAMLAAVERMPDFWRG
ncbi:MAG: hypothetical protein CTY28_09635 [Hyphomicrobium sp.]|nr:MAG: hypothetical protein CTY28_09635 [Hyphomicrobium sp.]